MGDDLAGYHEKEDDKSALYQIKFKHIGFLISIFYDVDLRIYTLNYTFSIFLSTVRLGKIEMKKGRIICGNMSGFGL